MSHAHPFTGQQTTLRPFTADDIPALADYLNHPELAGRRYVSDEYDHDLPLSRKQVEAICENWIGRENGFSMAIVLRASGVLVGHLIAWWGWDPLCPDFNIVIAPDCQRKGYGTEVARMTLRYLFEALPANVVTSGYSDWNEAARQFSESLGFTENGVIRRVGLRRGSYVSWVMADILRREWQPT